ncbi:MAG: uroporphyrinogen decarboxylase family protein [Planctomycetota bacterium]
MTELTSRERFLRMFNHQAADRIPIWDSPWSSTIERWRSEGMPATVDWCDYFGLDKVSVFRVDNSPQYPEKTVSETETHRIYTSKWGVTMKQFKHSASTPEFEDFIVVDRKTWADAKKRMTLSDNRIDWEKLKSAYDIAEKGGHFKVAQLWFGFDITHSWFIGTERVLMAIVEDPEWLMDIFDTELTLSLQLWQKVLDAGYKFDTVHWYDDMGYKHSQFFSKRTYRNFLKPYHQRAIEWAHQRGMKAMLHSCGDVNPLIPDLIEIGLDSLNPLEVKAGMDPVAIKKAYGDKLVLHGGINAVLWDKPDEIKAEIARVIPALKENGGYIFASDHSIPSDVSLNDFKSIVALIKKMGSYE